MKRIRRLGSYLLSHPWWSGIGGVATIVSTVVAINFESSSSNPDNTLPERDFEDFSAVEGTWMVWESVSPELGGWRITWKYTFEFVDQELKLIGRKIRVDDEDADEKELKAVCRASMKYSTSDDTFYGTCKEENWRGEVISSQISIRFSQDLANLSGRHMQADRILSEMSGSKQPTSHEAEQDEDAKPDNAPS